MSTVTGLQALAAIEHKQVFSAVYDTDNQGQLIIIFMDGTRLFVEPESGGNWEEMKFEYTEKPI